MLHFAFPFLSISAIVDKSNTMIELLLSIYIIGLNIFYTRKCVYVFRCSACADTNCPGENICVTKTVYFACHPTKCTNQLWTFLNFQSLSISYWVVVYTANNKERIEAVPASQVTTGSYLVSLLLSIEHDVSPFTIHNLTLHDVQRR